MRNKTVQVLTQQVPSETDKWLIYIYIREMVTDVNGSRGIYSRIADDDAVPWQCGQSRMGLSMTSACAMRRSLGQRRLWTRADQCLGATSSGPWSHAIVRLLVYIRS